MQITRKDLISVMWGVSSTYMILGRQLSFPNSIILSFVVGIPSSLVITKILSSKRDGIFSRFRKKQRVEKQKTIIKQIYCTLCGSEIGVCDCKVD